ncbi:hypothetical protein SORDD21_00001 [Streptococcus oralis]|uniref:Uncharacterized protein n=1 Tax=Streptococcus oralis TaxID=1303 RepID=A0A139PTK8_STROR|nr:hypothetical protein SORDD21_00001 [Streptococcus oralis]
MNTLPKRKNQRIFREILQSKYCSPKTIHFPKLKKAMVE